MCIRDSSGDISSRVNAETYGAATVATADTTASIHPVNQVHFDNGSYLQSDQDINIAAGTDVYFNRDNYKVEATTDTFAGSAIPI